MWAKALGEKAGKDDKEADKIAIIRTLIILFYILTNLFIIAGVIRHWWGTMRYNFVDAPAKPKTVTVITPTIGSPKVRDAVKSVQEQTYKQFDNYLSMVQQMYFGLPFAATNGKVKGEMSSG